jgi:hypothetical protein
MEGGGPNYNLIPDTYKTAFAVHTAWKIARRTKGL